MGYDRADVALGQSFLLQRPQIGAQLLKQSWGAVLPHFHDPIPANSAHYLIEKKCDAWEPSSDEEADAHGKWISCRQPSRRLRYQEAMGAFC
jgi:hypothetical protein